MEQPNDEQISNEPLLEGMYIGTPELLHIDGVFTITRRVVWRKEGGTLQRVSDVYCVESPDGIHAMFFDWRKAEARLSAIKARGRMNTLALKLEAIDSEGQQEILGVVRQPEDLIMPTLKPEQGEPARPSEGVELSQRPDGSSSNGSSFRRT